VVRLAPNLGWRDVDALARLRTDPWLAGLPFATVDNEANLAALGELHAWPDPQARPSFLYVSGEVGIGAGIVMNGQLVQGRGFAGEFGHVTVYPGGNGCRCGATGCLEAYVNSEVVLREAGLEPDADAMARLAELARSGERRARRALSDAGTTLGIAIAGVVNLLDLPTVVLGGAYAPLAPWLIGPVTREIATRCVAAPWAPVTVRASTLDANATVVGAAGSVVRAVRAAPARWLPDYGRDDDT
jgi:predicted NBD/HSP70 family sugar kinase